MPQLLRESGVDPGEAAAIGDDVLARAQAFAGLPDTTRDVVIAPSIEEIYSYEPRTLTSHSLPRSTSWPATAGSMKPMLTARSPQRTSG
ncbi:hypothetical protein [Amycolatopsis sp. NPDC051128]|uniref:hypothetical protein n=1 Tax=Amycolatopsis sp. NPDC051128 TaxID=3155412 RepID=UPI003423D01F